ncbi:MAG: hypothetical protein JOZ62_04375, partial [Acidobacteriaceae bacterium]|nr:hypothetical protein [Acidobacteriaceae bacterium]
MAVLPAFTALGEQREQPLIQEALNYDGLTIRRIEFEPQSQPLSFTDLTTHLPFTIGSVFRHEMIDQAIENLFSTGRFSDIALDGSNEAGGVALRFITKPAYFVGHVALYGFKSPPNAGQLYGATKLHLGAPFFESEKGQALASIRHVLAENGFYHASVDAEVQYDPRTQQSDIAFDIHPGKRAR